MVLENDGVIITTNVSGEEIDINFKIWNVQGGQVQEYRAYVYSANGTLLDKEPDLYWKNVGQGEYGIITVSSRNDPSWNLKSVYPQFQVAVFTQQGVQVTHRIIDLSAGTTSQTPTPVNPSYASPIEGVYSGGTPTSPTTSGGGDQVGATQPPTESGGFFSSFGGGAAAGAGATLVLIVLGIFLLKK